MTQQPSGRSNTPPRWDLFSIFPDIESPEFESSVDELTKRIGLFQKLVVKRPRASTEIAPWLKELITTRNTIDDLFETLANFSYCLFSVDTGDELAAATLNRITEFTVPLAQVSVDFRNCLAEVAERFPMLEIVNDDEDLSAYALFLEEEIFLRGRQLSAVEEELAADLARSGSDAWTRLQETLSSALTAPWGDETRTVVELRSMATDFDRSIRERAYRAELEAWERTETAFAFALNGVKGFAHTLNERRGWSSTLDHALRQNRTSRETLNALIATLERSLPDFRRYFAAKARALGVPRLAFFDLFAPLGNVETRWSFDDASEFIAQRFSAFDKGMGALARRTVVHRWIDAEPRPGKVAGAYCISIPKTAESRILANFDESYDSVATLAHELGHAYHGAVLAQLPALQRAYPMTLAETASIFAETIIFQETLAETSSDQGRVFILEQYLQGAAQVVVDILSRFYFESELMLRRAKGELSARELREMMLDAQERTYGDALDPDLRHPWMWAVKGHYYSADLGFYNFPYAFGQLFSLALLEERERSPDGFADRYRAILIETGRNDVETVAQVAGFDTRTEAFWQIGIDYLRRLIDDFDRLIV